MALPKGGASGRAKPRPGKDSGTASSAKAAEAAARTKAAETAARTKAAAAKTNAAARDQKAAARKDKNAAGKARRAEKRAKDAVKLRRQLAALRAWVAPPVTRRMSRPMSVLILILNIIPFPGLGTALYGHWERGLAQFLLTFLFLIGWIWAIIEGIRIVVASFRPHPALRAAAARRQ